MFKIFPGGGAEQFNLYNLKDMFANAENLLLILAIMAVFLLLLWSGIMYLTAYGSEEKALKAKNTFFWAIIGMIVILLSKLVIGQISGVFVDKTQTEFPTPTQTPSPGP